MSKRSALLIPAILCFLATLAFLGLKSMGYVFSAGEHGQSAAGNTPHPSLNESSDKPPQTKRNRHEDGDAKALRGLEAEFDEILPAQFPKQFSSLCDTTLDLGETLVLGGFRKADGDYEFTMLNVEPIGADDAPLQKGAAAQYKVKITTSVMSRGDSLEVGFGHLISPAMTRIQKSIAFPPGENRLIHTKSIATMSIFVTQDQAGSIQIGTDDKAYVVSMIVSPEDTGKSTRIRTRVESPAVD
jgi:hypothetical protein